jgi:hypothetical protein
MKNLKKQLFPYIFVTILGVLLHFTYEWSGENFIVGLFSATNESTWEHMKIALWPMFIFAIIQSFYFKNRKDFWYIKLKGILLGIVLIPIIFYTYNGVIGKSPDIHNEILSVHNIINVMIMVICNHFSLEKLNLYCVSVLKKAIAKPQTGTNISAILTKE